MAGMNSGTMSQLPMIDMSSTQALLNIVRSASAQNAQQLETYLRSSSSSATAATSATKRPADPHAPLDLSAHVAKRPYIDPLAPFKAVEMEALLPAGGKKSPTRPPTGGSANKTLPMSCRLTCAADSCSPAATQVQLWTVTDVVNFVKTIDLCQEYAEVSYRLFSLFVPTFSSSKDPLHPPPHSLRIHFVDAKLIYSINGPLCWKVNARLSFSKQNSSKRRNISQHFLQEHDMENYQQLTKVFKNWKF